METHVSIEATVVEKSIVGRGAGDSVEAVICAIWHISGVIKMLSQTSTGTSHGFDAVETTAEPAAALDDCEDTDMVDKDDEAVMTDEFVAYE
jgi:hypothetical protein